MLLPQAFFPAGDPKHGNSSPDYASLLRLGLGASDISSQKQTGMGPMLELVHAARQ